MADSSITKKALADALKQLMQTTAFSKISVGNICSLCDMNRKSFYYHFKDKYDLLQWIFYTEFIATVRSDSPEDGWELLEKVCEYFYENRTFYVNAFEIDGQDSFCDYFTSVLQTLVLQYFGDSLTDAEHEDFFSSFFTQAYVLAIQNWLKEEDWPPDLFVENLKSFLMNISGKILK